MSSLKWLQTQVIYCHTKFGNRANWRNESISSKTQQTKELVTEVIKHCGQIKPEHFNNEVKPGISLYTSVPSGVWHAIKFSLTIHGNMTRRGLGLIPVRTNCRLLTPNFCCYDILKLLNLAWNWMCSESASMVIDSSTCKLGSTRV